MPIDSLRPAYDVALLDDDKSLCRLMDKRFKEWGLKAKTCDNIEEFTSLLRDKKFPKVAMIDINLITANSEGFSLIKAIRNKLQDHHLPIIAISRRSSSADIVHAFECGADDYLQKPLDMTLLGVKLKRFTEIEEESSLPFYKVPSFVKEGKADVDVQLTSINEFELSFRSKFLVLKRTFVEVSCQSLVPYLGREVITGYVHNNGFNSETGDYFFTVLLESLSSEQTEKLRTAIIKSQ